MKKIKNFEEFEVNEISQYLANKATLGASNIVSDTDSDKFIRKIKKDQRDKFISYVNPDIKNKADALGFYNLTRYNVNYSFNYTVNNTENYEFHLELPFINKTRINYNGVDINADSVPSNILKKVYNLFNYIKINSEPNED